jgi:hypothetical protein
MKGAGGYYNSVFFLGLLIYSRFQGSIYFSELIKQVYQVEYISDQKTATKKKKKKH